MKEILLKVVSVDYWEKQEKSFVFAMMIMGVFNLVLVLFMLSM